MIDRDDHEKISIRKQRMNAVPEVSQEEKNRAILRILNSDSDAEIELEDDYEIGKIHYQYKVNDEVMFQYRTGICAKTYEEFQSAINQLGEDILNQRVKITIHKVDQIWEDVPSPTMEEIQRASEIVDQSNPIEIQIPKPQSVDSSEIVVVI